MRWHVRYGPCWLTAIVGLLFFALWTVYSRTDADNERIRLTDEEKFSTGTNEKGHRKNEDSDTKNALSIVSASENTPVQHEKQAQPSAGLIGDLQCKINGEKMLTCLRDSSDEIYVPFKNFLQKNFEITGYVERKPDGEEIFYWWHSNAKMQRPSFDRYDPFGVFGSFATYNVENRDRVKCVSAIDGVPLSVQWTPNPYHYPIQIAQFALEHYSRNVTEREPFVYDLLRGDENEKRATVWRIPPDASPSSFAKSISDEILHFKTDPSLDKPGIFIPLSDVPHQSQKLFTLRLETKFAPDSNASVAVILERLDTHTFYTVYYVRSEEVFTVQKPDRIYYGLGRDDGYSADPTSKSGWRIIARNLLMDFSKGYAILKNVKMNVPAGTNFNNKKAQKRNRLNGENVRLVALTFRGEGWLRIQNGATLRSSAHWDAFRYAADWFMRNQDEKGGWPIPVRRTLAENRLSLEAGWYSAMAQGHAMSVLCRAYQATKEERYLRAAYKATNLFSVDAESGGVRNRFLGSDLIWYEEYPTHPAGTFVLNGFIYSLIGLYDLRACLPQNRTVDELYARGLRSLKSLLLLFDTGSGSVYDLRHVTLKIAPNVARWDYHSVHVYQLLWMYLIEKDPLFLDTAERWLGYARGDRAKHN